MSQGSVVSGQWSGVQASSRRAIALLLVVAVLAVLSILAIPFAVSMAFEERTARNEAAAAEARLAARTAANQARGLLARGHPGAESQAGPSDAPFDTPEWDGMGELDVAFEPDIASWLRFDGTKGIFASATADDESGLVNLNSASLWLLANLWAPSVIAVNLPREGTEVEVDSTAGFPESGAIWVNGERIEYRRKTDTSFLDCRRDLTPRAPEFRGAALQPEGTVVVPMRAYALAIYPMRDPTRWQPFQTVEEARRLGEAGVDALPAADYGAIRDSLTVHSPHADTGDWIGLGRLRNDLPVDADETTSDFVQVDEPRFLAPGSVVRIRDGNHVEYGLVRDFENGRPNLNVQVRGGFTANEAYVDVLARHPVNLSTAPLRVLFALFHGLHAPGGNLVVRYDEASAAALAVDAARRGAPIASLLNLRQILAGVAAEDLPSDRTNLIMANGQNPLGFPPAPMRQAGRGQGTPHLDVQTAPYSFVSGNVYRIEAGGRVGSPSGVEVARHTVSQIVRVASPGEFAVRRIGQRHFQRFLELLPSNKVITWPVRLGMLSGEQIDPAQDSSGSVRLEAEPVPGANSFPAYHEGVRLTGPTSSVSGGDLVQVQALPTGNGVTEMATGGLAFWFKLASRAGGRKTFLADMGSEFGSNRFSIYLEGDEVVLSVADATLEPAFAELRVKGAPPADIWTHVWAGFKSTEYGHLSLLVDGEASLGRQYYRSGANKMGTYLASDFPTTGTTIQVEDASGFPQQGVLEVGGEVLEYESLSGNSFTVRATAYPGFAWGVRNRITGPQDHARGEPVIPFGYRVFLAGNLPIGGATLAEDLPVFASTNVNMAPVQVGNQTIIPPLGATDVTIPVVSTAGFQDSGYALIQEGGSVEIVFHQSKTGSELGGCQRGQLGTQAQVFTNAATVTPISIHVTDVSQYPDSGWIQIDDEWIETSGRQQGAYFMVLSRGTDGTIETSHTTGASVIPTFDVAQPNPCGRGDRVTLIQGNDPATRMEAYVNWTSGSRVAFDRFTVAGYAAGGGTRLLKFPSGELAIAVGPVYFAGSAPGTGESGDADMLLDDLLYQPIGQRGNFYVLTGTPVPEAANTIRLSTAAGMNNQGGVVKVGDEMIAYQTIERRTIANTQPPQQEWWLLGLTRGYMDSAIQVHANGAPVFNQAHLPVTSLGSNMSSQDRVVRIAQGGAFKEEGYVRIGREMIGYTRKGGRGLSIPAAADGSGLFRGAFGTIPDLHSAGEPVFDHPFRYCDRWATETDSPDVAWYPAAFHSPGSLWKTLTFRVRTHDLDDLAVDALVRFDGGPEWSAAPVSRASNGSLALFEVDARAIPLGVIADTLEVRLLFRYDEGAFWDRRAWKETAWIEEIVVSLESPEVVLEHREGR
ncbi:MAG: hypothetical protein HY720_30010 [Planctomycetes bacterium]|nr:hypothetical protein [Planctomycetota bacterium]